MQSALRVCLDLPVKVAEARATPRGLERLQRWAVRKWIDDLSVELGKEGRFRMLLPFGRDSHALLATEEPLEALAMVEQAPVLRGHGSPGADALRALLDSCAAPVEKARPRPRGLVHRPADGDERAVASLPAGGEALAYRPSKVAALAWVSSAAYPMV